LSISPLLIPLLHPPSAYSLLSQLSIPTKQTNNRSKIPHTVRLKKNKKIDFVFLPSYKSTVNSKVSSKQEPNRIVLCPQTSDRRTSKMTATVDIKKIPFFVTDRRRRFEFGPREGRFVQEFRERRFVQEFRSKREKICFTERERESVSDFE